MRGWNGSGTIFFSLCNLRCVFCQNWDISQQPAGSECPPEQIADLMMVLQAGGHQLRDARTRCTASHRSPRHRHSTRIEPTHRLQYQCLDAVASLKLFDGLIDIYMPDFKF
ncbi:MAG: hypothetical protein ACREYE_09250 [Gammaproteobacteria bacterium]